LEYWNKLVAELYEEMQSLPIGDMNPLLGAMSMSGGIVGGGGAVHPSMHANFPLRKHLYTDVLSNLRQVMIERMVKPEEVRYSAVNSGHSLICSRF
jgi:exportin-1